MICTCQYFIFTIFIQYVTLRVLYFNYTADVLKTYINITAPFIQKESVYMRIPQLIRIGYIVIPDTVFREVVRRFP